MAQTAGWANRKAPTTNLRLSPQSPNWRDSLSDAFHGQSVGKVGLQMIDSAGKPERAQDSKSFVQCSRSVNYLCPLIWERRRKVK